MSYAFKCLRVRLLKSSTFQVYCVLLFRLLQLCFNSQQSCDRMASLRQNSWFSGIKLSIEKILALTYAWAHKFTTTQAVHETSLDDETMSRKRCVIRGLPRTGTSKELFESYLQEYMWCQHYGEDPFGNIIKHIADLYEVRKDP